jgi:hypothetical protein
MIACTLLRPSRPNPAGAFRSLDLRNSACGVDRVGSGGNVALISPRGMNDAGEGFEQLTVARYPAGRNCLDRASSSARSIKYPVFPSRFHRRVRVLLPEAGSGTV